MVIKSTDNHFLFRKQDTNVMQKMHEIHQLQMGFSAKKHIKIFLCRTTIENLIWTNLSRCCQFSKGPCGDIDLNIVNFLRFPLWVQFNSTPIKSLSSPSESALCRQSTAETCSLLKEQQKHCLSCTAIASAFPRSCRHWAPASHIPHYNTGKAGRDIWRKDKTTHEKMTKI